MRPEFTLMSVENFRTFVIHSRNQILGGFDEDRLCSIFLGSIERTFLFIRQTQPFLKRFCKRNIFEKIVARKSLAHKAEARKRELLIMMRMKPQDQPFQRAEPAESSKYRRNSRYTLWKARSVRFCHIFPRELDV